MPIRTITHNLLRISHRKPSTTKQLTYHLKKQDTGLTQNQRIQSIMAQSVRLENRTYRGSA